jgi:hypothetical protein
VATEYAMPDLFDGVSARDAMKVQRAVGDAETQGEPLRANVQAKTWVGVTVADVLGLDLEKRHEKAKAKAIVGKWIENGVLRKTSAPSKRDGRDVPCVVVGEWITGEEAGV